MAAPPLPRTPALPRTRAPGPPLKVSIPLLILGVIGVIACFVGLGEALLHSVTDAAVVTTPASVQVECRTGTYLLFVESGSSPLTTGSGSITVTGPGGQSIPLNLGITAETISRVGERFTGQLGFSVATAGTYTVTVRSAGTSLVVAPSFITTARGNLGWDVGLLVSLIVALVGLVLLIVGLVQRSKARRRASYAGGAWGAPPSAGWPGSYGPPPGGGWTGQPGWSGTPAQPAWPPAQGYPPPQGPPGYPPPQGPPAQPAWPPPQAPSGYPPPQGPPAPVQGPPAQPAWPQPSSKPPPSPD
jgi:hypothetical protein